MTVFLYGSPASGKTTLGRKLAAALSAEFVDLDEEIVRREGRSIPDIFAQDGESSFRALESETLSTLIASRSQTVSNAGASSCIQTVSNVGASSCSQTVSNAGASSCSQTVSNAGTFSCSQTVLGLAQSSKSSPPADSATTLRIISLGGGTLLNPANRKLCENSGRVLCLDAPSPEELDRRLSASPLSRPLGDRAQERAAHYASFPNRISAFFSAGESLVVVGNGIAPIITETQRIVADATVASVCANGELAPAHLLTTIPSGESNKTPETVMSLWHAFADAGLGRRDVVASLGGGVTGDLVGFAAATWMRGIDWINVPTTLLAMVDASTGGKTGCDLPEGKNLAGAFHAPRLVVIDTDFLRTLPPEVLASGRAEMIKHEVIGGRDDKATVNRLPSPGEIARNLMVKVGIVREDPFERKGRRILLNCGHTIGHAIEKMSNYRLSHGEAVAIGCVEEARLAVRLGLAPRDWPQELAASFSSAGLPTSFPWGQTPPNRGQSPNLRGQTPPDGGQSPNLRGQSLESLIPIMRGDKKREGGGVTFALPCGWGDVRAVRLDLSKGKLP